MARPTPRMLRLPAVIELTGLGRDTIYRMAERDQFPRPRKLSERASAWREDEVRAWLDSRPISTAMSPNPRARRKQLPAA